jgi:four helix bundle protein
MKSIVFLHESKNQETRVKKKESRKKKKVGDKEHKNDLCERLFNFSVDVLNLLKKLDKSETSRLFRYQLGKSSTSSGANYEESQAGVSRADFMNKVRIALKEMRESNYWLRLLKAINEDSKLDNKIDKLVIESGELKKILGSIVNKK